MRPEGLSDGVYGAERSEGGAEPLSNQKTLRRLYRAIFADWEFSITSGADRALVNLRRRREKAAANAAKESLSTCRRILPHGLADGFERACSTLGGAGECEAREGRGGGLAPLEWGAFCEIFLARAFFTFILFTFILFRPKKSFKIK